jgi:hypothetical protein
MAEKADEKKLAKVKRHQFRATFYDSGVPKYEAGKHYPITDETTSQVAAGNAEVVTVEVDPEEHSAQEVAANAALKAIRARTHAAEADARKRGEFKD